MNFVDLVHKALTNLYKRDGNKQKYYSDFEVWCYLLNMYPAEFNLLGYDRAVFTHFDMNTEVLTLIGDNNGIPFRVQKEDAEDGSVYCFYWIP